MEIEEAIFSRRSVRKYDVNRSVSENELKIIISAGIYAPSGMNFQSWKFVIINDDKLKSNFSQPFVKEADKLILVTYRNDLTRSNEFLPHIQSASAAIENMLLMATGLGIGSCWLTGLGSKTKLEEAFNVPKNYDIIGLITLGYPAESDFDESKKSKVTLEDIKKYSTKERRFGIDDVVIYNKY